MSEVEIKETTHKGKGIFATRNIKKGEIILYVAGQIKETAKPISLPKDVDDHCWPIREQNNKLVYIHPHSPWKYINHSCDPNTGIKNNRYIVAMKQIKKGDEITKDYAMNNIGDWRMKCKCGSTHCRKIIGTLDMLDEKTKKKYKNYVTDHVRKLYLNRPEKN